MVATIVALETFADQLLRTDLFNFTDSEVVEAALVKGYSRKEDICLLVSEFWNLVPRLRIRVFIERVATDSNPADAPSRDDFEHGRNGLALDRCSLARSHPFVNTLWSVARSTQCRADVKARW